MVVFSTSPTASWLAAGLCTISQIQSVSAMLPGVPHSSNGGGGVHRRQFESTDHKWAAIKPSRELEWQPCYTEYDPTLVCARLIVPMDYENCASNQTVTLAVIKRPAQDTENYLGPLFVNPGGPGGSGVNWVAYGGEVIHRRVGVNHDLISWDPRGVGRTTPSQTCWANNQRRSIWNEKWAELDTLAEFDDPNWIRQVIEQYKYEHKACEDMLGRTGILQHLHTAAHAHDLDRLLTATGNNMLRYLGVSWGSVLATYYASIFPHKVERIVSEANVDVRHWVQGILPSELDDASRHFDYFYRTCAADKACALHEPTTEGVKQRLDRILEGLKARPVIEWRWNGRYSPLPYLDTIAHARGMLDVGFRETTYFLRDAATYLAGVERVLSQTNWNHLDGWSERSALGDPDGFPEFSDVKRADPYDPDYQPAYIFRSEEITQCSDWPEPNLDIEKIQSDVKEALALSQTGGLLPKWKAWCAGATRPKKRYEGPFGGNTSFPILFLNSWDIVTPVVSAFRNSEIFPGSEVLTLDAYGHGATLESDCINAHVYAYFQNGTMPETNTTCADIPDVKYGWEGWEPESEEEEEVDDIPVDGPLIGGFRRRDARPQAEDLYEKVRSRESRLWSI